jgi:predicted Fe-Mo cluster-binding NifX family protein
MKIAMTTSGDSLDAPMDSRFGRAPRILVYDLENSTFDLMDNVENMNAEQGAGVSTAEAVVRSGAGGVITGHCGPSAFRVLTIAGVSVLKTSAATVAKALELYRSGKLTEIKSPDMSGHWV